MSQCGGPWKVHWHPHHQQCDILIFFQCGSGWVWVDGCGGVSSFREAKRPALTPQFVSYGVVLHRSPNFLSRTLLLYQAGFLE